MPFGDPPKPVRKREPTQPVIVKKEKIPNCLFFAAEQWVRIRLKRMLKSPTGSEAIQGRAVVKILQQSDPMWISFADKFPAVWELLN